MSFRIKDERSGSTWLQDVIQRCKDYTFRARLLESLGDPGVQARLAQDPAARQLLQRLLGEAHGGGGSGGGAGRAPSHVFIEEVPPEGAMDLGLNPEPSSSRGLIEAPPPRLPPDSAPDDAMSLDLNPKPSNGRGFLPPGAEASAPGNAQSSAFPPLVSAPMQTSLMVGAKRKGAWEGAPTGDGNGAQSTKRARSAGPSAGDGAEQTSAMDID